VVHLQKYRKRRAQNMIVFLEIPKKSRAKNLRFIQERLDPIAQPLRKLDRPHIVRDPALVHRLLNLWAPR
jgi:hypothetical protein